MIDWNSLKASHDTQRELMEFVNGMLGDAIEHFVTKHDDIHRAVDEAIDEVCFQLRGLGAPQDFLGQYHLQLRSVKGELADMYVARVALERAIKPFQ